MRGPRQLILGCSGLDTVSSRSRGWVSAGVLTRRLDFIAFELINEYGHDGYSNVIDNKDSAEHQPVITTAARKVLAQTFQPPKVLIILSEN